MTDSSPVALPDAAASTLAQRALRWIGYIGMCIYVWFVMSNGFDGLDPSAVYLLNAALYCSLLLAILPDTLSAPQKVLMCVGGALVGATATWLLEQTTGEFSRYARIMIPVLLAIATRMLAARWAGSH